MESAVDQALRLHRGTLTQFRPSSASSRATGDFMVDGAHDSAGSAVRDHSDNGRVAGSEPGLHSDSSAQPGCPTCRTTIYIPAGSGRDVVSTSVTSAILRDASVQSCSTRRRLAGSAGQPFNVFWPQRGCQPSGKRGQQQLQLSADELETLFARVTFTFACTLTASRWTSAMTSQASPTISTETLLALRARPTHMITASHLFELPFGSRSPS